MIPDYDRVFWFYDGLARVVFGGRIETAKRAQLNLLKAEDSILIVGGGSGSLLKYLDRTGMRYKVDFVDASKKMLAQSKKLQITNLRVNYFHRDILEHTGNTYDIIFTNFFFDQFDYRMCEVYLQHLKTLARSGGILIHADFVPSNRWQDRIIQKAMYNFFRITIKLGKVQLLDYKSIFLANGLVCQKTIPISPFIVSESYRIA